MGNAAGSDVGGQWMRARGLGDLGEAPVRALLDFLSGMTASTA